MYNWKYEAERWTDMTAEVMKGWDLPNGDIVICNYDKFGRSGNNVDKLLASIKKRRFDCIVLDEAHYIKNRQAARSKRICTLATQIPHRLALTGTPAHNKIEDIWNILHFLDRKKFSSYWKFLDEWCSFKNIWTPNGMVKTPDGINPDKVTALTDMLRSIAVMRKRDEVIDWSTEQDVVDIPLPCTTSQTRYLSELCRKFCTTDGMNTVECEGVLDRLIRYRQICDAPHIVGLGGNSPKIDWVKAYMEEHPEHSVLIFSNSKKMLYYMRDWLEGSVVICGDVPAQKRQAIVEAFQSGKVQILLCQTQACKEGLTLDRADATIFLDVYPPMADYLQAKDRAVPCDATRVKPKTVYRLMMSNTFDQVMYNLVDSNVETTDVINNFIKYGGEQ